MNRRHDLDWVRVCAFVLLIAYHVGMYYVSWDWHIKSPLAGPALEPYMMITAPWRLSLLFLVSGVASAFLLGKGERGFLRERSWRLLLPLVFGMFVVVPPQSYYQVIDQGWTGSAPEFYRLYLDGGLCRDDECLLTPTWNHLWFVVYLWAYTLLVWLLATQARPATAWLQRQATRAFSGIGLLLGPAALLIGARVGLYERFGSTHALIDDVYNHAQYLPVFLFGFLVARADGVWAAMRRQRWIALLLALASLGFLGWYFHTYTTPAAAGRQLLQAQRAVWGLNQWSMIVAVLGFAQPLARRDGPVLRYLTEAVFPVYILHQTLIIVVAHALRPYAIAPRFEGPLLIATTFAGCFAGYEIVRRVPWLRPLFGLKSRLPAGSQPRPDGPATQPR